MYKYITPDHYVPYDAASLMQDDAYKEVLAGQQDGIILVLEHTPVFTAGLGGGSENLIVSEAELNNHHVDLVKTNRGGNITFHGPGQIVAYPIINLSKLRNDVYWYMATLEDIVIKTLQDFGIEGYKKPKYRGVWVEGRKISAVGVHVKNWITTHGLSLNVAVDKEYFKMINPCGITGFGICSLEDYIKEPCIQDVKNQLIKNFKTLLRVDRAIDEQSGIIKGGMVDEA